MSTEKSGQTKLPLLLLFFLFGVRPCCEYILLVSIMFWSFRSETLPVVASPVRSEQVCPEDPPSLGVGITRRSTTKTPFTFRKRPTGVVGWPSTPPLRPPQPHTRFGSSCSSLPFQVPSGCTAPGPGVGKISCVYGGRDRPPPLTHPDTPTC